MSVFFLIYNIQYIPEDVAIYRGVSHLHYQSKLKGLQALFKETKIIFVFCDINFLLFLSIGSKKIR